MIKLHPRQIKRFWSRVDIKADKYCWNWVGHKQKFGHGYIVLNGKYWIASRLSWLLCHGKLSNNLCVCHKCDNPSCVNPKHLFLGTQIDNLKDRDNKGRTARGTTQHSSKLTVEDIKTIRRIKEWWTQDTLSQIFGVSQNAISRIIHKKTWEWI